MGITVFLLTSFLTYLYNGRFEPKNRIETCRNRFNKDYPVDNKENKVTL